LALSLVESPLGSEIDDSSVVYRKSGRGAAQLAMAQRGELSPRERHVLIVVDGRRTVAELSELFGAETVGRLIPELEAKGFVKRIDPELPPEWAAITQFAPGLRELEASKPAPRRRWDDHLLAFFAVWVVVTIGSGGWLYYRIQSGLADHRGFEQESVQTLDAYGGVPAQSDVVDRNPLNHPPLAIEPIAKAPVASATGSTRSPGSAVPQVALRGSAVADTVQARHETPVQSIASTVPTQPAADATAASAAAVKPPEATADTASAAVSAMDAPAPTAARQTDAPAAELVNEAPPAPPASEPVTLTPLRHDPPRIPEKAVLAGIVEGDARVRLWITPEGKVDQVDVIEARPPGVFDDEVRRVLSLWTFDPPGHPADEVIELTLKP
jgi:TonB family protein